MVLWVLVKEVLTFLKRGYGYNQEEGNVTGLLAPFSRLLWTLKVPFVQLLTI